MRCRFACPLFSSAAFLLLAACVPAAPAPSAQEILARTAAMYSKLHGYQFRVTVQTIRGGDVSERHFTASGAAAKFRIEDDDQSGELRVGDGKTEWALSRGEGKYSKSAYTPATATPIGGFEQIDQDVSSASIAREETFAVAGKPRPIYVVRVTRKRWPQAVPAGVQNAMYRIDKATLAVYKVIYYAPQITSIWLYAPLKWDEPVPESLFAFAAPPSAREVPAVAAPEFRSYPLAGAPAPDFTLSDAKGSPVHLADLRGKVVVVDFWATWCPPCRAEMPILQKMQNELGGKGLAVLGLDVGEEAEQVTEFAKQQSYTFTLLLGAEPEISAKYFVEAYPTVFVVDRQGKIKFRELGGGSPDELRAAVEAALNAK